MFLCIRQIFISILAVLSLSSSAGFAFAGFRPTYKDLPSEVKEVVAKEAPPDRIQRIYRGFTPGRPKPDYHVVIRTEKKQIILWLTNEGKVLSRKEGPIPAVAELVKPPAGSVMYGVFEGRTPCPDCEKIKTGLTLHQSAKKKTPTTYVLQRVSVGKGNDTTVNQGKWKKFAGKGKYRNMTVIQLGGDVPPEYSHFLLVGDNLLLLLDADLEPRVGDSGFSFTLSRTE
jgi:hypothetical protein